MPTAQINLNKTKQGLQEILTTEDTEYTELNAYCERMKPLCSLCPLRSLCRISVSYTNLSRFNTEIIESTENTEKRLQYHFA